jgi:hypothetical protein
MAAEGTWVMTSRGIPPQFRRVRCQRGPRSATSLGHRPQRAGRRRGRPTTGARQLGRKTRRYRGNLAKALRRHFGKKYDARRARSDSSRSLRGVVAASIGRHRSSSPRRGLFYRLTASRWPK